MSCPVVRAIDEIRGGGLEDETGHVVIVGGYTRVVDDVAFYMTARKLDFARFELSGPKADAISARHRSFFGWMFDDAGKILTDDIICARLIDKTIGRSALHDQFIEVVEMMGRLETTIYERTMGGELSDSLNISLPEIVLQPNIDRLITYRPDVLKHTVDRLVAWVNAVNVVSISAGKSQSARVETISTPPDVMPKKILPSPDTNPTLVGMKSLLAHEMHFCAHLREIEKYHCEAVTVLGRVVERIGAIIDDMMVDRR